MKNKFVAIAGTFLAVSLLSEAAFSQRHRRGSERGRSISTVTERIQIPMGDQTFRGHSSIALKRQIKHFYPNLNLRNAKLSRVVMIAKTKAGLGTAQVLIAGQSGYPVTFDGRPRAFDNPNRRTFSRHHLGLPTYQSQGPWRINLRGQFKVRRIMVEIEANQRGPQNISVSLGHMHLMGPQQIPLKQLIKRVYPGVDLRSLNLAGISVFGKSKRGGGQVNLVVGGQASYSQTLPAYGSFRSSHPGSYAKVLIRNPSYNSFGRWVLQSRGNIKIDRIVFHLKR